MFLSFSDYRAVRSNTTINNLFYLSIGVMKEIYFVNFKIFVFNMLLKIKKLLNMQINKKNLKICNYMQNKILYFGLFKYNLNV